MARTRRRIMHGTVSRFQRYGRGGNVRFGGGRRRRRLRSRFRRFRTSRGGRDRRARALITRSRFRRCRELHNHTVDAYRTSAMEANTTGAIYHLTAIAEGTAFGERTGQNIILKGIHIRGVMHCNTASYDKVRLMLFRNQEPAGTVGVSAANIQAVYGSPNETTVTPFQDRDAIETYRQKMGLLWKKRFQLARFGVQDTTRQGGVDPYIRFRKYIRMHKLIHFDGAETSDPFGGIWLYLDGIHAATNSYCADVYWTVRVYYENCS